jgi:hypothetical protein
MTTWKEFNTYGEDLQKFMLLRTYPIAVKMYEMKITSPKEP